MLAGALALIFYRTWLFWAVLFLLCAIWLASFMSVAPETVRACEKRGGPGNGCDDDVVLVSADRIHHVRPATATDLPAGLKVLAETRAERPRQAAPAMGGPSHRQEAAWERAIATTKLTVYLAATETEAVRSRPMEEPWSSRY